MPSGFYAGVDEARSAVSCHPRYERPLLSNVAAPTQRHAALQGSCGALDTSPSSFSFIEKATLTKNFFQIITIGDCSKGETRRFFQERLIPRVPEHLRRGLNFEHLYEAFGGKFAHWHDYITDYGTFLPKLASNKSNDAFQSIQTAHSMVSYPFSP